MGTTVEGGRYRSVDGEWKDAWGAPLPPPDGDKAEEDDAAGWGGIPRSEKLKAAGYDTLEALAQASDDELLAIDGIGSATVEDIRAMLNNAE